MVMALQALMEGLLIGGIYAIAAVGLSLAFGVMRIINWAQGELLMVSMYISYMIFVFLGFDPYLIMFFTAAIMFGVGYFLQSKIISNLLARASDREPTSVLLWTAGLGIVLTDGVHMIVGSNPFTASTRYTGRMLNLGGMFISVPKLISCIVAVVCTLALYLFIRKSETGRAVRATSQNRVVATLMGVDQKRIYNLSFGISIGLVGIAGALLLPYYPVSYTVGASFSFRSFMVVVLGGKGSVIGALWGGLIIGVVEKMAELYISSTYAQMLTFLIFIAMIIFRPYGLLGEKDVQ